ncbi:MAG: formylglycine-generating enzyme family protein [Planctomycetota bacterium]|jgi:hypothetical protein
MKNRPIPLAAVALSAILSATSAHAGDADADIIRRGLDALPALLQEVDADDADVRLRSRRLATRIALDHFTREAPKGMRLVHGPIRIDRRGVHLDGGLYLSAREVTVSEFAAFAKATKRERGRWAKGEPESPVVWVSLDDALAYAKWKKARLPTLEELSSATTSFGRFRYPWGSKFDARFLNSKEAGRGGASAPGGFARGRSPAGIDDLLGNVSEWTTTTTGKSKRLHIFGGSFKDRIAGLRAPFAVNKMARAARDADVGFRLAKSLPRLPTAPPRAPASDAVGKTTPR